mmetsp:Transcript_14618/g.34773  ORF Transcript_14618/g.34773 Transcript_14618/m.34773 type:complete len:247 (+) Transcript_14618:75-815(+)
MGQNCTRTESSDAGAVLKLSSARPIPVIVHVYDLGSSDHVTLLNSVLKPFGSGAFHCGVEVYGLEWSFSDIIGRDDDRSRTGIFSSWPKQSPGHRYVESVEMGFSNKTEVQVLNIVAHMEATWPVSTYNVLRRNCCHFADELCKHLGVGGIPPKLLNLAKVGVSFVDYGQAAADAACCSGKNKVFPLSCCYATSVDKHYQDLSAATSPKTKPVQSHPILTEMEFEFADAHSLTHESLIEPPPFQAC